jgi:hypothetical protein
LEGDCVFEIVVDVDSLKASPRTGNVDGIVYVRINGDDFPDDRWWDFPCIVLDWWRQVLSTEIAPGAELRFMDGPAAIQLEVDGRDLLLTPALNDRPRSTPVRTPAAEVRAEVDRAIAALAEACRRRSLPVQGFG